MSEISWKDHLPKIAIGVVVVVTSYFALHALRREIPSEEKEI
jgi:hypothetical protein